MKTCAYTKLDGERCTNPVEGKMHFCCGAHKQAAYRLRQFAVQRFEKETTAHLKTQLSNAIREYNDITCDETLQSWREEGWLTARERQEALEHYREAYDDLKREHFKLFGEYCRLFEDMVDLRERVRKLEAIVESPTYWEVRMSQVKQAKSD